MNSKKINKLMYIYLIILGFILIFYKDLTNIKMEIVSDLEYIKCGSVENIPRPFPQITTIAYTLLTIGTPLILIVFSIISLVKALGGGNGDDIDKAKKSLFKKFIIAAVIFFIGFIVQFVIYRVTSNDEDKETATTCLKCFLYYSEGNCGHPEKLLMDNGERKSNSNVKYWVNSNKPTPVTPKSNIINKGSNTNTSNNSNIITNSANGWDEGTYGKLDYMFYKPSKVLETKPLIIYLHGRDEFKSKGGNLKKLDQYGFSYMIKNGKKDLNAYVLIPNAPSYEAGWGNYDADLMGLIEKLITENGIDRNRITLTGFSAGAEAITDYLSKHPDYFSNVIIFARKNPITTSMFKNLHTWVVWGENDGYSNSRCPTIYYQLNAAGYSVRKDSYPLGHNGEIINRTIDKADFMNFVNQSKK